MGEPIMLDADGVQAVVDPDAGGRVGSLRLDGTELLVDRDRVDDDPGLWGLYPMVPWAGRVRDGRFTFRGDEHQLPIGAPPHAIHGVGHVSAWEVVGPATIRLDLAWPFGGVAEQRFELRERALTITMSVTAGERAMPVVAGWHPCFRRRLDGGGDVELSVDATAMWERDATGIPTGELVSRPAGPWDDAFTGFRTPPRVTWPGAVELTLRSDVPVWVVYDQDPRLVCVEPQTDAPDAFNRNPAALEPGQSLDLAFAIEFDRHSTAP